MEIFSIFNIVDIGRLSFSPGEGDYLAICKNAIGDELRLHLGSQHLPIGASFTVMIKQNDENVEANKN